MFKLFIKVTYPFYILVAIFIFIFIHPDFREWVSANPDLEVERLTIALGALGVLSLPFIYRAYKILDNIKRYGTKEEQVMDMRLHEMMKSEGKFSKEGVEKFFPEIANEDKIR